MNGRYKNKYRITTARRPNWNYARAAAYFITICTARRECFFGKVSDGNMELSETGKIAEQEWLATPHIRPDMHLELGAFVVMPNHFHAIIIIGENEYNSEKNVSVGNDAHNTANDTDGTPNDTDGTPNTDGTSNETGGGTGNGYGNNTGSGTGDGYVGEYKNSFGPQRKNLASVLRGFKSAVTMKARRVCPEFGWQILFHDHIIRNEESFNNISAYIINNPANWEKDKFYIKAV